MFALLRIWCPHYSRSSTQSKLKVKLSLIAQSNASSHGDMKTWTSQRKSASSRASQGRMPSTINFILAVSASTSRCRVAIQLRDSTEPPRLLATVNNEFKMLIFKTTEINLTVWYECGPATLSWKGRTSSKSSEALWFVCLETFCRLHYCRTSHWRICPSQLIYSGISSSPSRFLELKNLDPLSIDLLAQHSQGTRWNHRSCIHRRRSGNFHGATWLLCRSSIDYFHRKHSKTENLKTRN